MYNVSSAFLTKIKESSRKLKAKVIINEATLYEDTVIDFSIEGAFGSDNIPIIGGVTASKLTLNLINNANIPAIIINVPVKPYIAVEVSEGTYEWVPLGVFYAEYSDIIKTDQSISMDCFDKFASYDEISYSSSLSFPATIEEMKIEITSKYGVTFAAQTLPSASFSEKPEGTLRQVLGQMAAVLTTNAVVNVLGEVEFRFLSESGFTMDSNNYIDFKLTSAAQVKISQLTIQAEEEENNFSVGDGSGYALKFENSGITNTSQLQTVFDRQFPLYFHAYSLKSQGMPHLQVGDKFNLTDKKNVVRSLTVVNHKLTYKGGLISEFAVDAPRSSITNITLTGGTTVGKAIGLAYNNFLAAVSAATKLITGNQGGYVVMVMNSDGKPQEITILDTEDINTAVNVWRWNASGLGHSSTGYNGTYSTAITADGHIVADFMDTGSLNAGIIDAGVLKSVNDKVHIDLEAGTFRIGESDTNFKVKFDGTNLYMGGIAVSWNDLTDKPTIPAAYDDAQALAAWVASGYKTYINENGVYTGELVMQKGKTVQISQVDQVCALQITENDISATGTSKRLWLNWYNGDTVLIGDGTGHGSGTVEDPYDIGGYGKLYAGEIYSNNVLVARVDGNNIIMGAPIVMPNNPQLWVQADEPTAAKSTDVWVDTDDYSRYDVTGLTVNTVLNASDNEVIEASGTITITLHAATDAGIIKKIYNTGTGIITIAGTINGITNMYLYPGESVELLTDGTGWRC